jgi:hypothetical protein
MFTPIDPLFLLIPLVVSLLSPSCKPCSSSNPPSSETAAAAAAGVAFGKNPNAARYLPLDDLIYEASLARGYCRLDKPFTSRVDGRGKVKSVSTSWVRVDEEEETACEDEGDRESNEDVMRLFELDGIKVLLRELCEDQGEFFFWAMQSFFCVFYFNHVGV